MGAPRLQQLVSLHYQFRTWDWLWTIALNGSGANRDL